MPTLDLPLPDPSARRNLDPAIFGRPQRFGDIEKRLRAKLDARGYEDTSYYEVRGGFAMITKIERIDDQGKALPGSDRFALESSGLCRFRLTSLLDCLLDADPGRYRVIVFLVTTAPVTTDGSPARFAEAQDWLDGGGDFMPAYLAGKPLTAAHNISALVYEFRRPSVSAKPAQVTGMSAISHLSAAGLFK